MPETFDDFCRACIDLLKAKRVDYIVIGGVAVTAVGEPRFTADLDVIVFMEVDQIDRLITYAIAHGFRGDLETELESVHSGGSLRLTRGRFHFDLIVRSLFIEDQARSRARAVKVFRRTVKFPTPEDLVILKLVAGRPRDLLDVEGIVRRHEQKLDRRYIEKTLRALCDLAEDHTFLERWRVFTKPAP